MFSSASSIPPTSTSDQTTLPLDEAPSSASPRAGLCSPNESSMTPPEYASRASRYNFTSIFSMPSTPRILPFGGSSPSDARSHNRVNSQPDIRVKQDITVGTKRTQTDFDDPCYITSLLDPRLTQVLEYAPQAETNLSPGIILHSPLNRPLSPTDGSRAKLARRPVTPYPHATNPPHLMVPHLLSPAMLSDRSRPGTPTSCDTHFSNFTDWFASPAPSPPLREVNPYLGLFPQDSVSPIDGAHRFSSTNLLSPMDAYHMVQRSGHQLPPAAPSRPQSARPASMDARLAEPQVRLSHKRKTSLQHDTASMSRPKRAESPMRAGAVGARNDETDEGPQLGLQGVDLSTSIDSQRSCGLDRSIQGPPSGMPSWVPLPISSSLRPTFERHDTIKASPLGRLRQPNEGLDMVETPTAEQGSFHAFPTLDGRLEDEERAGGEYQAVHSLQTLLQNRNSTARTNIEAAGGTNTAESHPDEEATAAPKDVDATVHPGANEAEDALQDSATTQLPQHGLGSDQGPPIQGQKQTTSINVFIGAPELRTLIESPSLQERVDPIGAGAGGDEGSNVQLELARRCAGDLAEPQLTVGEIELGTTAPTGLAAAVTAGTPVFYAVSAARTLQNERCVLLDRDQAASQNVSKPAETCRPSLNILKPVAQISSASPRTPLASENSPTGGNVVGSPSPLTPKQHQAGTGAQEEKEGQSSQAMRTGAVIRKRSIAERRRDSSGAPLELPTLRLNDPCWRSRTKPDSVHRSPEAALDSERGTTTLEH